MHVCAFAHLKTEVSLFLADCGLYMCPTWNLSALCKAWHIMGKRRCWITEVGEIPTLFPLCAMPYAVLTSPK